MKHTPGPWMVQHQGPGTSISIIGDHNPHYPFLSAVHTDECGGEAIALANAKLIAAAPDLLKALEAVIDGWDNWDDKGRIESAIETARAAIAKATA